MRRSTFIVGGLATVVAVAMAGISATAATAAPQSDAFSRAVAQVRAHATSTHFVDGQRFTLVGVITDKDGAQHVRIHRYQDGLPVLGGDLVAHLGAGNTWRGVSQTLTGSPRVALQPRITAAQAASIASSAATAGSRSVGGSQLVIDAGGDAAAALAYAVVVSGVHADATPSELHVLVDAHSGRVRDAWEGIQPGTGNTYHSGTVTIGTTFNGSTWELNDLTRGGHKTYDLNHGTSGTGTLYTSATNVFGDGTLADSATTGADAHYGAQVTWDYYLNVHGRNGIRNDGVAAYSRVHCSTNYINAFWSDSCFCMTYGDGNLSQNWSPLTSLDVAGHEMTHGVTSNTANLRYSGEPGGLNEATSDIFGTLVEFHAANANDPGDYLIGEEAKTDGTALRYMYHPSIDGASADCWNKFVKTLDVHYSSGVANHFFYLLAVGTAGPPASPTCNSSTITGIGNADAGAIWYRALTVYMTSRTNYKGARTATLNAAADLFGSGSTQYNTVAAAWSAVSVS